MAKQTTNRTGKTLWLYPEQVEIKKGFNVRFDMGDITQLAKSIQQNGIIDPLKGYRHPEKKLTTDGWPIYIVTEGHRRIMAANRVKDRMDMPDFIPFIEEPKEHTEQRRVVEMLTTGENKKTLNLLEAARGVWRLMHDEENPMKQSEIAKEIGKSPMYVSDCVLLMEKATDKMINQMETGQVAPSTIIEMLKVNDVGKVEKAVSKAIDKADEKAGGKGKGKVKASQIREESGEAMTTKGKKADKQKKQAKEEKETTSKEPKMDKTLEALINLRTALKAQEGKQIKLAFGVLNAIIKLGKGEAQPIDLIPVFFEEDEDGQEEEKTQSKKAAKKEEASAPKKPAKKAAEKKPVKKSATPKKKKEEDDDDDDEPSASAIKKAAVPSLDDDDDDDDDIE